MRGTKVILGRVVALMEIGLGGVNSVHARPPYSPYADDAANGIYNRLFCDDPRAFTAAPGTAAAAWQKTLASEPADLSGLRELAADATQDGRIRFLGYSRLRALRQTVPAKILFGVVVEVPLEGGLDTLAAFSDGSIRYINHSGKMAIYEGLHPLDEQVRALFAASAPLVDEIGPWTEARRPPPQPGDLRLSFLVSDGLYFGEGPMDLMEREKLAAPVIRQAVELLQAVTSRGVQ